MVSKEEAGSQARQVTDNNQLNFMVNRSGGFFGVILFPDP